MDMIERVARALCRNDDDGELAGFSPAIRAAYLADARAALEAMREPTGEMVNAVARSCLGALRDRERYRAMIDAALTHPAAIVPLPDA